MTLYACAYAFGERTSGIRWGHVCVRGLPGERLFEGIKGENLSPIRIVYTWSLVMYVWLGLVCCVALVRAFRNPIIPGFNPDPSILRVGDDYFLATSTFEWFPGVPIYHSRDLIQWDLIGHALNRPSQLNMRGTVPSGGIWAPTLRYNEQESTFYMATTNYDLLAPDNVTRVPRSFYVKTTNIWDDDSWSDPIYVEQPGFDPDLFFEGNKTLLSSALGAGYIDPDLGRFAIWKTEIDRHTGNSLTDSELFHVSTLPLEARLAEGSHLYKKDGWYYLLTAEAGTGIIHRAMIKRALSLDGPWIENPNNPIIFNGQNLSLPILSTGHTDLVETPSGDWYAVFLGIRPQVPNNSSGHNQLGRETFMAPVVWDEDGWPVVNGGNPITFDMPGLYDLARPKLWRDDFSDGKLKDKAYYTARTPYKIFHSLTERPGYLRLRGNPYNLGDREIPAALFRKQVDLEVVWSTELEFAPTNGRHEAGATIYLSIHYHNEIAVTLRGGNRTIVARTGSGSGATVQETFYDAPGSGAVNLFIRASCEKYELGFALPGQEPQYVAEVASRWLQAHLSGWSLFTGAFFGVYATGASLPILVPADFKYVQTELVDDVS